MASATEGEPQQVELALINRDNVVAGFTVIEDKVQKPSIKCQEVLPFWITHATTFSTDLNERYPVEDVRGLDDRIVKRLKVMGCAAFFPVQNCVIPFILRSYRSSKRRPLVRPRDICVSAPTGSGKTLAYAVPLVQLLLNRVHVFLRALIILPVRDLAVQVYNVFKELTHETDLQVALLCGLKSFIKEQADLVDTSLVPFQCKTDIVIATPGRLVDHLYNTPGLSMERLRILVIDEADRVIVEEKQDWYRVLEDAIYQPAAFRFDPECGSNVAQSPCLRKRPVMNFMHQSDTMHDITLQKILVSATLTHDPGPLKRFNLYFPQLLCSTVKRTINESGTEMLFAQSLTDEAEATQFTSDADLSFNEIGGVGVFTTPPGLKENVVPVTPETRVMFLVHLIRHKNLQRILCFTNARITAIRLATLLRQFRGVHISQLSAQMPPEKRQRILNSFSRGDLNILVCTDAMARGMDIKDVECVVSYDMPPNVKTYVHRVGRTARAGQTGIAYTLLSRNQFFHFKNDLKGVGKSKMKEVRFHTSQMNDIRSEYKMALKQLELSVKKLGKSNTNISAKRRREKNTSSLPTRQNRCETKRPIKASEDGGG